MCPSSKGGDDTRYATAFHLWSLGVGAVISGDFFGWQAGLISGFYGLIICMCIASVMYVLLVLSIAELSAAVPSGGGPYIFALRAIGPKAAFFAGLAETLKVIVTVAVVAVGIGSYLTEIFNTDEKYSPLWWILFYAVFNLLNVLGVQATFKFQLFATLFSIFVLLIFYIGAATVVDFNKHVKNQDMLWPNGLDGFVKGLSFSLWFYLGIEELPLAIEQAIQPEKSMPKGIILSMLTLIALSFSTLFFNSSISPGAYQIFNSTSPLLDGYKTVFGDNSITSGFSWILVVGLVCSFHSFIFCMGHLLYAIALDGFFPRVLTILHPSRKTPHVALYIGSSIGLVSTIVLYFLIGITNLGAVLINLALIGAIVSYLLQLASFICLRIKEPDLVRPYRSVFGVSGAVVSGIIAIFVLGAIVYTASDGVYSIATLIAAVVYFALGSLYFMVFGAKVLIQSGSKIKTELSTLQY